MIDTRIYYCCRHFRKCLTCTVMFVRFLFPVTSPLFLPLKKKKNQNQQTTACNMSCSPPIYGVFFHKGFMGKKSEIPPEVAELHTVAHVALLGMSQS